jgi:FtsZ-interacting cell division protein ZipA
MDVKNILIILVVAVVIAILLYYTRKEKEVQIKNVILYFSKPIEHIEESKAENVFDEDKQTAWNPIKQEGKNYILGFDFNQIKHITRVKVISSKTKSYNSINELKIRMPNGELVYDTAKTIKPPTPSASSSDTDSNNTKEPQIIDIDLTPALVCDKILLEFFCDTVDETSCDVREVMFYEKQKTMF